MAKPTVVYVAYYTSDPTPDDIGLEVQADDYTRQPIMLGPVSDGIIRNATEVRWPTTKTAWGNVTHIGIRDALVGGNLLWHGRNGWVRGNGNGKAGDRFMIGVGLLEIKLG